LEIPVLTEDEMQSWLCI